jgi:glyoxylase-like metal-dependent hydrolase (beta-lactamase superfamily II)
MGGVQQVDRRTWLARMGSGALALWAGLDLGSGREGWNVLIGGPRKTAAAQGATAAQVLPVSMLYDTPALPDPLPVAAFVFVRGREAAIVDTLIAGNVDAIHAVLQTAGLGWGNVRHLILTHYHFDHAGNAADVATLAPQATIWVGETDLPEFNIPRPIFPAHDGDEVFGLRIVATPGHTPGHICVLDPVGSALVTGDAVMNLGGTLTGPFPQFSTDMVQGMASVAKMGALGFERALIAHGPTIERGASAAVARLAASGNIVPPPHILALQEAHCCIQ